MVLNFFGCGMIELKLRASAPRPFLGRKFDIHRERRQTQFLVADAVFSGSIEWTSLVVESSRWLNHFRILVGHAWHDVVYDWNTASHSGTVS